jgi:predicted DNA-binding transcriptional regulator YafY
VVNLARITSCARYFGNYQFGTRPKKVHHETVVLRILNERNMLERCMLHFAHFEKQAEKLDKKHYLVRIKYDHSDQPELVIRMLSFGPLVEVIGSEEFRSAVIEKLKKQKNLGLK